MKDQSYYCIVLGTEYKDDLVERAATGHTTQSWGSYIVTEETPEDAAANVARQYAQLRHLERFTPITVYVHEEGKSGEVALVHRLAPKSGSVWIMDMDDNEWRAF